MTPMLARSAHIRAFGALDPAGLVKQIHSFERFTELSQYENVPRGQKHRGENIIMRILRKTAHRSILAVVKESTSFGVGKRAAPELARTLLAALLTALLVVGPLSPAFAQSGAQNPPPQVIAPAAVSN